MSAVFLDFEGFQNPRWQILSCDARRRHRQKKLFSVSFAITELWIYDQREGDEGQWLIDESKVERTSHLQLVTSRIKRKME